MRSNFALNHSRRERNVWMQRRSAKNRHSNARTNAETKIRELGGRNSRQERPIWRRTGNVRFARAGWWRSTDEASSSFPLALRISLLAAALLAALVWILRLLARRLIRVLAGLSGLIALSILPTIPVGITLFVITSP